MTVDTYFALTCQLAEARPFRPFVVTLRGGTRHTVDHPQSLAVSPRGATAFLPATGGLYIFDHTSVDSVTALTPYEPVIVTATR